MSKIGYDELAVDGLKKILNQISTLCKRLDIDFFIVGAVARNVWHASHDEIPQGTKDIDFGIYVPTQAKYDALRKALVDEYDYTISTTNAFCLISAEGKQVDLLPFGEIEHDGKVMIDGKGLTSVNLDGFQESYDLGLIEVEIGTEIYKVCSIPAVFILKLIAFDDRPNERVKDAQDMNSICNHYPNLESETIWSHHFDLYDDHLSHQEVAMIVLGREMKKIMSRNTTLSTRIVQIIDKAMFGKSNLMVHMIDDPESETIEMKAHILNKIKQGIIL